MTDPTIPPGPSALLAFVRPDRDLGPILLATGEFLAEVRELHGLELTNREETES